MSISRILPFAVSLLLFIHPVFVFAQLSSGGIPLSFSKPAFSADVPVVALPAPDVSALMAEDEINNATQIIPYRFGYNHPVDITTTNSGVWENIAEGGKLWRLGIKSPGALTINLIFENFHLPEGASLYIYNEEKDFVLGAFTHQNNREDGAFSTTLIKGDLIYLEYFEPSNTADRAAFKLNNVTHGYRDIFGYYTAAGESGACNVNVNCPLGNNWQEEKRAVAMIIVSGNAACSGSLVNNTRQDATPYFLTANHCTQGSNVANWVFRFNYESISCNGTTSPTNQTLNGASLKANFAASDFALLLLNTIPPADFEPYYAGWSNSDSASLRSIVIHHPSGDLKKISLDTNAVTAITFSNAQCWEIGNWEQGTTEGGSSGSPLFNQDHRVVGQLYGGGAACGNQQSDNFGRFSVSWDGTAPNRRLKDWLDPDTTGVTFVDGFDPYTPTVATDAGILNIMYPEEGSVACISSYIPKITLRNYGLDTLTHVTLNYELNGLPGPALNWIGVLPTGNTIELELLAFFPQAGANTLKVFTSDPNTSVDLNLNNDSRTVNFVQANPIPLALPAQQGFDTQSFPNATWTLSNPDNATTWQRTAVTSGFGNSTNCVRINNFNYSAVGQRDYFFSPEYNFTDIVPPFNMSFSVAYARYSSASHDSLILSASTDCGGTWDRLYAKGNSGLSSTGANVNVSFVPNVTQWRNEIVNLNGFAGEAHVKFRFENYNGYGNNLYVDDINIPEINISTNDIESAMIRVYPNPAKDVFKLEGISSGNTSVNVFDMIGKLIHSEEHSGKSELNVNCSKWNKGIYMMQITNQGNSYHRKLVIAE